MFKKTKYFLAATALLGLALSGCSKTDGDTSVSNPDPNAFQPKGTVSGVLTDAVTQDPIANATVYIMDRSATTGAQGQFTIANVPANTAVGNEPTNAGASAYTLVIDMTAVNSAITTYNAVATNTTKKAFYPGIAYSSATVSYTSLGDANNNAASGTTTSSTTVSNHDTPVDGFVANILPTVGKLDSNIKVQVVKTSDRSPVSGATVTLSDNATSSNNNATGSGGGTFTGHLVATQTTDANGFVTFTAVEAKKGFVASGISSDGTLSGTLAVTAPVDGETKSYLVQGGGSDVQIGTALALSSVDAVAPFVVSTTPANLADIASGTTAVAFTFSEPIKASTYALATTAATSVNGGLYANVDVNFLGPKASNAARTLAWSTDMKTLTVTLTTDPTSKYSVSIDGACGSTSKLTDAAGNAATATAGGALYNTVTFSTSGGNTTAAPVISRNGTTTTIDWLPVANAYDYRVYMETVTAGVGSGYVVVGTGSTSSLTTASLGALPYSTGQTKISYNVKVVALNTNKDEGTASNILVIDDQTAPTLAATTLPAVLGNAGTMNLAAADAALTLLNTTKSYTITVTFSEQMDKTTVQDLTKWTVSQATATMTGGLYSVGANDVHPVITSVYYAPTAAGPYNATVTFSLTQNATANATIDPNSEVFTFSGTDLNGKAMSSTADQFNGASGGAGF